jgi:hypothetical protein
VFKKKTKLNRSARSTLPHPSPPAVTAEKPPPAVDAHRSPRHRRPQYSPATPAVLAFAARSRRPHCMPSPPALLAFATRIAASCRRLPGPLQAGNCTPGPRRLPPIRSAARRFNPSSAAARHLAATPGRSHQSSTSLPQVAASLPAPPDTRGPDYACSPGSSRCRYMPLVECRGPIIVFSYACSVLNCIQYFRDPTLSLTRNSMCE